MTKLKLAISSVLVAIVATIFLLQHQAQMKLREENALLREQLGTFDETGGQNQSVSNPVNEEAADRGCGEAQPQQPHHFAGVKVLRRTLLRRCGWASPLPRSA